MFWDLNGRNHEITLLKLKHIRFRDKYAEGEVPHEAKTGSGPILLTTSFPYVRDWINEHPFDIILWLNSVFSFSINNFVISELDDVVIVPIT